MIKIVLSLCIYFLFILSIESSAYTIFPVRFNTASITMPFPSPQKYTKNELSWQLARLMDSYVKLKRIPGYFISIELKDYLIREEQTAWNRFGNHELQKISNLFHFENILLSKLEQKNGKYHLTTAIYARDRNHVESKISTSSENLLKAIELNFSARHSNYPFLYNFSKSKVGSFLFILDPSGRAYYESRDLISKLKMLPAEKSAFCTLNAQRNIISSKLQYHEKQIVKMERLSFSGRTPDSKEWMRLMHCAQSHLSESNDTTDIILVTSGGLANSYARYSFSNVLNSFSRNRKVFIFATNNIDDSSLAYLKAYSRRNKDIIFYENYQWEKIATSKGKTIFLFQRNNRLYQSDSRSMPGSNYKEIPALYRQRNCTLSCLYKEMFNFEFITSSQKGYLSEAFFQTVINHTKRNNQTYRKNNQSKTIHFTVESDNLIFRLSLPYSSYLSMKKNNPYWKNHYQYFFVSLNGQNISDLHLNHSAFGEIIGNREASSGLLTISMRDYFQRPNRYKGKSFHSGSFYYIQAKILKIKIDDRNTNTDWSY